MSKSIDTILKELIESQTKQTVALNEKLTALAGDNNTYFDRMKKMEDGLTEAMKKVLEMDASMKECNKEMCKKVDDMESRYAAMFNPEQLKDKERTKDQENHEKNEPASIEKQEMDQMSDAEKKKKQDEADKKEHLKDDTKIFNEQKKELLKEAGKYKDQGGLYQGPSEAKAEYEEGSTQEPRRPDQEGKDVMPKPADANNSIEGVYPEKVTGQPDDEEDAPKQKRIRGGKKSKAEETNEEPKAEEVKEVKAEQSEPAPVASEESSINATAKALNSKIEAVLEKLASVSQPKPEASAEFEATKVALANETKAKEEAIAHMKALNDKFEALMAKVSTIEKSASTVEQKAAQIVAQTGVDAVAVSVDQQAKASEQTDEEVFKQFENLKGPEQRKYYLANKAIIERHASSLLRAKRS
jgi:hypothetical protein